MSPGVPLVCPVLVGRDANIKLLGQKVDEVCHGRGATVVVSGDAGLGKSRLVREGVSRAIARQHGPGKVPALFTGHCFEPDRLVPFAAMLDLIHALFSSGSEGPSACFSGREAIELSSILPRRLRGSGDLRHPPADIADQPHVFFYDMLDFLECLSVERPLVLVLEDLQWSDEASLQFLRFLSRRLSSGDVPMLLIVTYRTDQMHDALHHLVAALDRDRLATEIRLAPLSRDEVWEMTSALLGHQPATGRFVSRLHELTEGNPYYIEEVVAGIMATSRETAGDSLDEPDLGNLQIPRSIYEAVKERERNLSVGARRLLRLAAVAGRRFDFSLLRRLNHSGDRLLTLVKELVEAHLVVEEGPERFAFRHTLTREVILSTMLHLEKKGMHRAVAETIESAPDLSLETRLPELARHFYAAGVWAKAREYSMEAAAEAMRLNAASAAAEHLTRAIEAMRALGETPSTDVLRKRDLLYQVARETVRIGKSKGPLHHPSGPDERRAVREAEKQRFGGLTAREKEVAALVAQGRSNKAIAAELVVAERTIESHVSSILSKLGFESRTQIAAWAVERGLIESIPNGPGEGRKAD